MLKAYGMDSIFHEKVGTVINMDHCPSRTISNYLNSKKDNFVPSIV